MTATVTSLDRLSVEPVNIELPESCPDCGREASACEQCGVEGPNPERQIGASKYFICSGCAEKTDALDRHGDDDRDADDFDRSACPGCGGSCQVACR